MWWFALSFAFFGTKIGAPKFLQSWNHIILHSGDARNLRDGPTVTTLARLTSVGMVTGRPSWNSGENSLLERHCDDSFVWERGMMGRRDDLHAYRANHRAFVCPTLGHWLDFSSRLCFRCLFNIISMLLMNINEICLEIT